MRGNQVQGSAFGTAASPEWDQILEAFQEAGVSSGRLGSVPPLLLAGDDSRSYYNPY